MRPIRAIIVAVVLCALLASAHQPALGHQDDENLELTSLGQTMRATLRLQMVSRVDGVVGDYESNAVAIPARSGPAYAGSIWIPAPERMNEQLAPGFGDRGKIEITALTSDIPG